MNTTYKTNTIEQGAGYRSFLKIGAPGSGKGTAWTNVIALMKRQKSPLNPNQFKHYSSGDMFRRSAAADPVLAKTLRDGTLVNDETLYAAVTADLDRIVQESSYLPNRQILALDGVIRTVNQAERFRDYFSIPAVVYFDLSTQGNPCEELEARSARRYAAAVAKCKDLERQGITPSSSDFPREDDKPGSITKRYKIFEKDTLPLIEYFQKRTDVHVYAINALQPQQIVADALYNVLCGEFAQERGDRSPLTLRLGYANR